MGKASKNKGRRGEIAVARMMSAWWLDDESLLKAKADDLPIRRTPLSGGWSKAKGVNGDLVPIAECVSDFVFSVEVKNREGWSFDGILKDECWPVREWWKQCSDDAAAANMTPILLMTKNYNPWYFAMDTHDWVHLRRKLDKTIPLISIRHLVFGLFEDFVLNIPSSVVREVFTK